eukprot:symbB.v1.2.014584.t1/scaffold1069.1/size140053/8
MLAVDQSKKTFLKESEKGSSNSTLVLRLSHVADRILRGAEREAKGTESIRRSPAAPDLETDTEVVEELEENHDMATFNRGDHGRMATSQDAFVCRLKRKAGGLPFDREQNSDWYRLVLGESFPEVIALQSNDEKLVKDFFFSKFMNVQRTLALPHESGETVLKGHVNVQKVCEREDDQGQLDCNDFAVENLWTASSFFIAFTLCTFTKLDLNVDCSEIYFQDPIGLGGATNTCGGIKLQQEHQCLPMCDL